MSAVQARSGFRVRIVAALASASPLVASAGPTPADKCEAIKNKAVGAYYSCLEKAEATAITKAIVPDYSKCTAKFDEKWDKAETTAAGDCPDSVTMTADMNAFIAAQAAEAALVVAGAPIPDCAAELATCEGDLTTCNGDLATRDDELTACEGDLAACESSPGCGDGLVAGSEECDNGNLDGATCATQGFAGGTLARTEFPASLNREVSLGNRDRRERAGRRLKPDRARRVGAFIDCRRAPRSDGRQARGQP